MATTNATTNYELSQYIGSDVTSYLTNYNSDMVKIDTQMKRNADSAATANDNATIAVSTATTAASNASTALSTANTASSTASSAQTAAQEAQTAAGAAQTDAAAALRASASNSIGNLAPAYNPTLTYNVGDLVTYVDENNSGKLYKNIVPIASPEAFDINKWDDVTTSEVYNRKSRVVASHTKVAGDTYKTVLDDLYSQFTINKSSEYLLVQMTAEYGNNILHGRLVNSTDMTFTDMALGNSDGYILQLGIRNNNSYARSMNMSTGANVFNNLSATEYPHDSVELIELTTL